MEGSTSAQGTTRAAARQRTRELVESALDTRSLPGLPSSYAFHPHQPLLYFIGRREGDKSSSLYFTTLPSSSAVEGLHQEEGQWQPLLQAPTTSGQEKLSKEEELLRERMRSFDSGITSFDLHKESCQLLIPAAGKLYTVDVSKHTPEENNCELAEIRSEASGARMDAKFCPYDPNIVSFVRDGDMWLVNRGTHQEKRLTYSRTTSSDNTASSGVAEFVMQEEFDRYTGYWWQPSADSSNPSLCRILYLQVDESEVELFHIPDASDIHGKTDSFRYPLAGAKNAISRVCLVEFDTSSWDSSPVVKYLQPSIQDRFPWVEYIVRCGWTAPVPSPRPWLQLLDRKQQKLQLISLELSQFAADTDAGSGASEVSVLLEDNSDIWINVTNVLYFLEDGSDRFIWASEVHTGYRQLYLVSPGQQVRAITAGNFQVEDQQLVVDEKHHLVYFTANKDSSLETHLYAASYAEHAKAEHVHRLTTGGFHHGAVAVSPACDKFVSTFSNLSTPHEAKVHRIAWNDAATADLSGGPSVELLLSLSVPKSTKAPIFPAPPPELFSFTNHFGEQAYGVYWRPRGQHEGQKCPTLLYVYGGPHVQLVVNSYTLTVQFKRYQLLASEGVACVIIDGAGSWKRGLAWEGRLRNSMGTVEIHDQVLGLQHLMKTEQFIDPARIGVTGWSYGGYLSLCFLAQRPDFFKVAIAGGPVTLWEAYDTGYTERYMDTPQNNPEGYSKGSVLNMVSGFPDEDNRLLIIHGLIDENVHFCHTAKLIDELIKAGKPYQLQVFPSERHGVRTPHASKHLEIALVSFVLNHL